jgi:putative tricarboxylic transport membrane protein
MQLLRVAEGDLLPLVFLLCGLSTYAINKGLFDAEIVIFFGMFGYMIRKFDYEPDPLAVAFALCSTLEQSMRQSLGLSGGIEISCLAPKIRGLQ